MFQCGFAAEHGGVPTRESTDKDMSGHADEWCDICAFASLQHSRVDMP